MKHVLVKTLLLAGTASLATGAYAAQHTRSIEGCRSAIGEELNLNEAEAQFHLKKIKSRSRTRDLRFHVYTNENASRVVVNCKVKNYGEVLALDFKEGDNPIAATERNTRSRG